MATMIAKPPRRVFLIALLAAVLAPPAVASLHKISKPAFSPKSHVASLKNEEIGIPTKDAKVIHMALVEPRGGGDSISGDPVIGALSFVVIDKVVRDLFNKYDVSFPSQLGGCIIMFFGMVLSEIIVPGLGDKVFSFLNPGAVLLAKWLPVFFVPGLAMLPLAPSIGSPLEVGKVLAVVILGFLFSLSSTAFAVLGLRTVMGAVESPKPVKATKSRKVTSKKAPPPPKAFSDETMDFLIKGSVLSGVISVIAARTNFDWATPIQTVSMIFITVATYVWGARLPSSFTKVVHPLVTSTALSLAVMRLFGMATDSTFLDVLRTFKVGSMELTKTGAGDVLLYLLGPSVVSFSMSMYSRKTLLVDNLFVVLTSMLVSSAGGLFGTGAFVRLIRLGGEGDNFLRRSVLSRNVTTALAIAVTAMIEGDLAIAASVVVLTGIIGATYGRTLLTAMGIKDPISRGLGIGASGQGLGVASIVGEPDAFPFAAISMVLTAVAATTLVSIPVVKEALLDLVGGAAKTIVAE